MVGSSVQSGIKAVKAKFVVFTGGLQRRLYDCSR
jgi:hypothetical protein